MFVVGPLLSLLSSRASPTEPRLCRGEGGRVEGSWFWFFESAPLLDAQRGCEESWCRWVVVIRQEGAQIPASRGGPNTVLRIRRRNPKLMLRRAHRLAPPQQRDLRQRFAAGAALHGRDRHGGVRRVPRRVPRCVPMMIHGPARVVCRRFCRSAQGLAEGQAGAGPGQNQDQRQGCCGGAHVLLDGPGESWLLLLGPKFFRDAVTDFLRQALMQPPRA